MGRALIDANGRQVIRDARFVEVVAHDLLGIEFLIKVGGREDCPVKRGLHLGPGHFLAHHVDAHAGHQHQDEHEEERECDHHAVFFARKAAQAA